MRIPLRRSILISAAMLGVALLGETARVTAQDSPTQIRMKRWGASPCADPALGAREFYCLELKSPAPAPTDIRFAIHPAQGAETDRLGVLVTFVGGPGEIGLVDAPEYLNGLSSTVRNRFDLVWFNQRGIDPEHKIQCPRAQRNYAGVRRTFPYPIDTREKFSKMAAAVQTYATACHAEIENTSLLPYVGTKDSVADIERFRTHIGEEKLYLYGQSYGTQFGQTYVTTYPTAVDRIVLDGVVDLTFDGLQYFTLQVQAFDRALARTLRWCAQDDVCKKDFPRHHPLGFYDHLVQRLSRGPITAPFPVPGAGRPGRKFYLADLEMIAYDKVYSPPRRGELLELLAAAANGNFVPLLAAAYGEWSLDPQTEVPCPVAKGKVRSNDAPYYAVECRDYAYPSYANDPLAFFREGKRMLDRKIRLASAAYMDFPCAFWPGAARTQVRPKPFSPSPPLPVMLLSGTRDPATPVLDVRRMIKPLGSSGRKIELKGAGHVILDMNVDCVVTQVDAFLTAGKNPAPPTRNCETALVSGYRPRADVPATDTSTKAVCESE